jgi:hypothetical protein
MLAKLRAALAALLKSQRIQTALRDRAVRRMHKRHAAQEKFERQQHQAEDAAEALRHRGNLTTFLASERLFAKALRKEAKAQRLEAKAETQKRKAIVWKTRARRYTQRIHGIEVRVDKVQEELAKLEPTVHLKEQKVTGGTFPERWIAHNLTEVERCADNHRRNAYSQSGRPDIWHPYGPGPAPDRRDDCSSDTTAAALATGAKDPNGLDFNGEGFTGTLVGQHNGWKEVSLQHMIKAGQGYVVYGSGDGHHVERYVPSSQDQMRTVGHGSAPVDFGTVHLFGTGEVERYFIYAP